jgi:hypothetical protein
VNVGSFPPQPLVRRAQWFGVPSLKVLRILLSNLLLGCIATVGVAGSDPVDGLKRFSEFRALDPAQLLKGEILGQRGALMAVPQGISAQTCFAVPVPAEEAAERLQLWDPARHDAPNVLSFSPVRVPCDSGDFEGLKLTPNHHAIRWLLDKSLSTSPGKSELNLTAEEARQLANWAKSNRDPQTVSAFWSKLLLERTRAFQRLGFAGVSPYETGGKPISPARLIGTMLREKPEIAREFAPLLERSGVLGNEPAGRLTPFHYWGLCEANHRGALNLGAVYSLPLGDHYQLLDAQYYVSGVYYACVTLYEVWPICEGGKSGALVWRGDFFAAPSLAITKGTERLAYGAIMLQELKKAVHSFQQAMTAQP